MSEISLVIRHLRTAALRAEVADLTDGQLLESFISRREAAALEALVRRHGPMVWGVCRRLLRNHHDAEDAFQATFLVLVRKAGSVTPTEMVGNWLYGVAHQTALKARATRTKRRMREAQQITMPEPAVVEPDFWNDLQAVLDRELSLLPAKYRAVLVLCDLEGKTRQEAARQLGCPEGTVGSRLARARTMLAKRLAQHGLVVSGGALAAVLSQKAASASVPTSVLSSTIKGVTLVAAGRAAAGIISVKVAALTEGVLKAMLLTKLKIATAVLLVTVAAAGLGGLFYRAQAAQPGARPTAAPTVAERNAQAEKQRKAGEGQDALKKLVEEAERDVQDAEARLNHSKERLRRLKQISEAAKTPNGRGKGNTPKGAKPAPHGDGNDDVADVPSEAEDAKGKPPGVYAANHDDPWNRIFHCLFTRTIKARLSDDFGEGQRVVERIEGGDRAIEPLYPSSPGGWTTRRDGAYRVMAEPLYSRFKKALDDALNESRQRPPLARALMQADLWAAHDLLSRNYDFGGGEGKRRLARREELLKLIAQLVKKVALTPKEIEALPDNYAAGVGAHHLPDLFGRDSAWCEVRWLKERIHDSAADYRRVARVFLKPAVPPKDRLRFVDGLRRSDKPSEQLEAVALVTQDLLIDSDGKVVVSPLTYEVQVRMFVKDKKGKLVKTEAKQYELNRQKLLHDAKGGGFVQADDKAGFYLPSAGNDYSFASNQLTSEPIRVRLETRCTACHGNGDLMTFRRFHEPTPPSVALLKPSENEHARYVIGRKAERKDFKALQERWKDRKEGPSEKKPTEGKKEEGVKQLRRQ